MQGDRERCLAAGFDGYLRQTDAPGRPARRTRAARAAETLPPQTPKRSLIEELTEICGGDEDFAHELALTFLRISSGLPRRDRAIALERAIRENFRAGPRLERDQPDNRRPQAGAMSASNSSMPRIVRTWSREPARRGPGRCLGGGEDRRWKISWLSRSKHEDLDRRRSGAVGASTCAARWRNWATRPTSRPTASKRGESCKTARRPLLISDWMMPLLDGPELCRRIRSGAAERYTYIILLTSRDRKEDRLEGLRAGADDFLIKPPDSGRAGRSPGDRRANPESARAARAAERAAGRAGRGRRIDRHQEPPPIPRRSGPALCSGRSVWALPSR